MWIPLDIIHSLSDNFGITDEEARNVLYYLIRSNRHVLEYSQSICPYKTEEEIFDLVNYINDEILPLIMPYDFFYANYTILPFKQHIYLRK